MFKVVPLEKVTLPVKVAIPGQERGELKVEVKHLSRPRAAAYLEALGDKTDREVIDEMVVGWSDVVDANGQSLDFNDAETRDLVFDNHHIFCPIRDAVFNELIAGNYAREGVEKN